MTPPAHLRAIALDVDGVLTDGGFWWGPNGEEFKRFHFLDVMGIARARRSGIRFVLISGEDSPLVDRFAKKLGIEDVFPGCKDKASALRAFVDRHALDLASVCFMGDDVNDLPAMALAGVSAAPANAHSLVLTAASVVTSRSGGNGAVREPHRSPRCRGPLDGFLRLFSSVAMKLSDYVMQAVAAEGVKHVFMLPGGGAMHLNDSLGRSEKLEYVCNLHEQAVAIAAEAYARVSGGLGVAMVTSGPGGTNALTGLAGAWLDSTPCAFLSGQVKRADLKGDSGLRMLGVQEIDIVSVVRPLTKYAVTVIDPSTVRYHLEKALYLTRSGRPGPVWLDFPLDVQAARIEPETQTGFDPQLEGFVPPAGDDLQARVSQLLDLLQQSARPVMLVGNGVRLAGASSGFVQLVDRLGVPVLTTWLGLDLIGDDHPLHFGRPGGIAPRGANFTLQNSDLLIVLGARLDMALTAYAHDRLARGAKKVMVDIDESEIRKMKTAIDLPIVADAGDVIRQLLRRVPALNTFARTAWLERCHDWRARYPLVLAEHRSRRDSLSMYYFSEVLSEELASTDVVASGSSGFACEMFLLNLKVKLGQRVFHNRGTGAMGFGLPASIGACVASGRRRTICVDGDGGFQMNIQELATVANLGLPIKFFVVNNQGYASIRTSQQNYFGLLVGADDTSGVRLPEIRKVAEAYGLNTAVIDCSIDLRSTIRTVLSSPGPIVCEVIVPPDEPRGPRVSSAQRADGSMVSKPLEDLWPFLDRAEFLSNMIVPPLDD